MNTSINYHTLQRLAGYMHGAVRQGAFFPFEELVKRFKKTTHLSLGGCRQKKRYLSALKGLCNNFGFQFVMASGTRGKVLYVTSQNYSHFKYEYDRETSFVHALLKALQTGTVASVKVYDTLVASTALTKKSLERPISILKNKAKQFGLIFYKLGRELYVKLKHQYIVSNNSKNLSKNTPQNSDITSSIVAKDKEILRNTPDGELRFLKEDRINAKAHWLSKRLRAKFYDNCKVKCCMPMLFKFTKNALKNGFEDKIIEAKFGRALLVRHADATDMGLNIGNPSFKFEMSSTVSLANQYLHESENRSIYERWNNLVANILPERKKTGSPVSKESEKSSIISNFTEKFNLDQNQVPYPAQNTASRNACFESNKVLELETHEEEMRAFLLSNGYNKHDIQIFQSFQKGLIPMEQIACYSRKIVKMGFLLAEPFSDRPEYNTFRK